MPAIGANVVFLALNFLLQTIFHLAAQIANNHGFPSAGTRCRAEPRTGVRGCEAMSGVQLAGATPPGLSYPLVSITPCSVFVNGHNVSLRRAHASTHANSNLVPP